MVTKFYSDMMLLSLEDDWPCGFNNFISWLNVCFSSNPSLTDLYRLRVWISLMASGWKMEDVVYLNFCISLSLPWVYCALIVNRERFLLCKGVIFQKKILRWYTHNIYLPARYYVHHFIHVRLHYVQFCSNDQLEFGLLSQHQRREGIERELTHRI